ncbi:unnamed protein product [Paramecium sonneborni]|uniref:Uncharacterized protein n=1 Tax=Paramecium sonneborni TaxID=65129 RepID=A0A8S1K258_9CILI|nr:unnamed protein product [Paramecium sonneborni]
MQIENISDKKSRSRSRSKSSKRKAQHNQTQIKQNEKHQNEIDCFKIVNKECNSHNSSPNGLKAEISKSYEHYNKEEYKILDRNYQNNLAPNNQFQIQCENNDQGQRCLAQKEIENNINQCLEKHPSEMITINDSSQDDNQDVSSIEKIASSYVEMKKLDYQKLDSSKIDLLRRNSFKIQKQNLKRSSQDHHQLNQQIKYSECIDLTNDDNIQSFFGLNHPMFISSMEYNKKELFELTEPYEYSCGNFMISLGIRDYYTAIVTLPSLYQKQSVYYLFMMFQYDQNNIYCMVPEDDQTTLLVSSNIQSLYYFCNSDNQLKKNNKTNFLESTLKYKFPYIYPTLIRKFIVSYKKNDLQIQYQINYDSEATQLAIQHYYQALPGYLITGTSHPILKILFFKSQKNQIPQFYHKFLSTPLYVGQFSLKAHLEQNGDIIVIERKFLSPFCYGIHSIKIEINRVTDFIVMKQIGKDFEIQSKNIKLFWNEIQQKYLKLYPSKLLYNYFVDLILEDRKIQEQYKKWNQLYDSMNKSQSKFKSNGKPITVNDKQFYCFSIEEVRNGNRIKYL